MGVFACLAISVAVAGASMHDHSLDDGAEGHARVCVLAGTAVLPSTDAPASVVVDPAVPHVETPLPTVSPACEVDRRPPRVRGPPAFEFVPV